MTVPAKGNDPRQSSSRNGEDRPRRVEFHDIAAVVHFLRKVVWMVPDFTVDRYEEQLRSLHERIESEGPFVAHSTRHLVDARRPAP